ncbi:hypothetical protein ACFL0X_01655 [Nanoarchaeota archaeon]
MTKMEVFERLNDLGLLERLDEPTKIAGISNFDLLTSLVGTHNNAVSAIYPLLARDQRDKVVEAYLDLFGGMRYDVANRDYSPKIREPQLLADITIEIPLYWPGLHDEEKLWKDKKNFVELQRDIMTEDVLFDPRKVRSDFLVAYALMRTKFGDDYVKVANPNFLERVLKGIVALRFAGITDDDEIEKGRQRLHKLLPEAVHDRIEPLRQEADWIIPKQSKYNPQIY